MSVSVQTKEVNVTFVRQFLRMIAFQILFFTLIVMLLSCNRNPVGPDEIEPHIQLYWNQAIVCLVDADRLEASNRHVITPTYFNWQSHPGTFTCDSVEANGCFNSTKRLITYNADTPWVIIHEAAHAILWYMQDKGWKEHDCN